MAAWTVRSGKRSSDWKSWTVVEMRDSHSKLQPKGYDSYRNSARALLAQEIVEGDKSQLIRSQSTDSQVTRGTLHQKNGVSHLKRTASVLVRPLEIDQSMGTPLLVSHFSPCRRKDLRMRDTTRTMDPKQWEEDVMCPSDCGADGNSLQCPGCSQLTILSGQPI